MVERIVVTDSNLKVREEAAIADLRAFAPDGIIVGIDSRDKALGKRLSKLSARIGYESRKDMIEALGFTVASKGGRPASVDPVQIMDEICTLYSDRAPFDSVKKLEELLQLEHPEIAGKLKTIKNNAKKAFGHPYGTELEARGLLSKSKKPSFDEGDVRAAIEALIARYANAEAKPRTLAEIYKIHPEYKLMELSIADLIFREFGLSPKKYFAEVGVMSPDFRSMASPDALEEVIRDIRVKQAGIPNDELPKNIAALIEAFPEHADVLRASEKAGLLKATKAKEAGILKLGVGKYRKRRNYLIEQSIRNAPLSDLKAVWLFAGLPPRIDRGMPEGALLPSGVMAVDLDEDGETRETLHAICALSSEGMDTVKEAVLARAEGSGAECEVVSEFEDDEYAFAQVSKREKGPLRSQTLAYTLWRAGVFADVDLKLTDIWRVRYADAFKSA